MAKHIVKSLVKLGYDSKKLRTNDYSRSEVFKMLKIPAIYESLPVAAKAYLKYKPDRAIPRAVITILDTVLSENVVGLKYVIAGSYRRGKDISNDADIIISKRGSTEHTMERFSTMLAGNQHIEMLPPYMSGEDRISTMFRITAGSKCYVVKSDIFITNPDEYIFMLLYATGSGMFNIMMRAQAKRRGYLLNQHGLYKAGTLVPVKNEREIFDTLGITYRTPENRDMKMKKR